MKSKILSQRKLSIKKLIPIQGEFKKLTKANFNKLKSSIEKNGFIQPFFVWEDAEQFKILDGHQRQKAIIDLYGDIDVDCLFIDAKDEIEAKKLCIFYSSSYATFDKDSFLNFAEGLNFEYIKDFSFPSFSFQEKDFLEDKEGEDEIPETKENECGVKLGDIYQLGDHKLMCGDSTDSILVNSFFKNEEVELCFTSPPYSDIRKYCGNIDLSVEKICKFLNCKAKTIIVNLGIKKINSEFFPYWDYYIQEAKKNDLKLLSWNVWDKLESTSIGSKAHMFPLEHEWIFVFGKDSKELNKIIPNKNFGKKFSSSNRQIDGTCLKKGEKIVSEFRKMGSVYRGGPLKNRFIGLNHPAMFPVEFPESYILSCTNENEFVYDPFGGSGTTLIACEKTKRKCFMMEIAPHYCSIIIKRWEKYSGEKAVKV